MRLRKSSFVCIPANAAILLICLVLLVATAPMTQAQITTVTGVTVDGLCGTENLINGQFTALSGGNPVVAGLGQFGATLYGGTFEGNMLYQVDPANCTYTPVGSGSLSNGYHDFGATTGGLYGIAQDSTSDLYSVNPSNGATTFIGPSNLPTGGGQALSADCPVLYATAGFSGSNSVLYLVNTTTAAITEIGDTGVAMIEALVCANGSLYGTSVAGNLYTLSLANGQATLVAATQGGIYGLGYLASFTLTVSTAGNGTVTSTDGFINCPGSCTHTYLSATQVTLNATPAQGWVFGGWSGACLGTSSCTVTMTQTLVVGAVFSEAEQFVPLSQPCRAVDTRPPTGNGPIQGGTFQNFAISGEGGCAELPNAAVYSMNVTVVPGPKLGYLTIWPAGEPQPVVSTLNSVDGRVKADAAIVPAGTGGAVSIYVTDTTNVIVDVNGYFAPVSGSTLAFYPLAPCRVADTRKSNFPPGLGPPSLSAGVERQFPILNATTTCNIPASGVAAYSLNFTVVPSGTLGYLTVWPTGQSRPTVSTLNDVLGRVIANAAIVVAGTGSEVSAYATNNTDLVIDIDGYFAPAGTGGLSLYPAAPCRVIDTRHVGSGQPFTGTLSPPVDVVHSQCGVTSVAQAYVFNATVIPVQSLGYLTLWPDGENQPVVSTLNAADGSVTNNMAIVPAGTAGKVDAFANGLTQLLLDISSYFAP
jgi:hypothetical protein